MQPEPIQSFASLLNWLFTTLVVIVIFCLSNIALKKAIQRLMEIEYFQELKKDRYPKNVNRKGGAGK